MKMRPDDYVALKIAIKAVFQKQPNVTLTSYFEQGLTAKRFRWDALHASGFDTSPLWGYLTDAHIDTALRRITKTG